MSETVKKMDVEKIRRMFAKRRTKDLIFYSLLLALPLLQFCIFYVGVNLNSLLLAFKTYQENDQYAWAGWTNFANLFESFSLLTVFRVALVNSLKLFFIGTLSGLICGLLFSYYIYKKALLRNFFKILLFLPSIIPSIALVLMFKQIADGAIPALLAEMGITARGLLANPDTTFGTIIFYNVWVGFGVSILLYVGAMEKIPEGVVEAAELDGTGYFQEFIFITIPLVWDTMSTFIIVAVGGIFVNQANIYAFYSDAAEEYVVTIGYYLYKETVKTGAAADYPVLSAFGILLSVITIPLVYAVKFVLGKIGPATEERRRTFERQK